MNITSQTLASMTPQERVDYAVAIAIVAQATQDALYTSDRRKAL